jgi:hypothetical protein
MERGGVEKKLTVFSAGCVEKAKNGKVEIEAGEERDPLSESSLH